jgi:exodeoxyribonuclease VII small subunit
MPLPAMPTDPDIGLTTLSFEDALAELERIVRGLEGGQQRLEDAISAYERGSALRRHCETKLREAEMRVEKIVTTGGAGAKPAQAKSAPAASDLDEEIPF